MIRMLIACVSLSVICSSNGAYFDLPALYQLTEPVDHAEGPTWDAERNILFFVDVHTGGVYSYNYDTKAVNHIILNGEVTPVIPSANNHSLLIVGLNRSVVAVEWDGTNELGKQKVLTTVSEQFPTSHTNDGKADSKGRLWLGTLGDEDLTTNEIDPNEGVLYKIDRNNLENPTVEISPVNISNGLAWNAANDKLFFIDSSSYLISEYDFNSEEGTISNYRVAFNLSAYPDLVGIPDGMTIDEDDNLWVALFGGGYVIQVNPRTGALLRSIALPARYVTSVMWGGPNLDILFVTTSRIHLSEEERLYNPAAGSLFAITNLKTKGRVVFDADIVDSI